MDYKGYLGYVKYTGELVEDGILDARKSAKALLGLDHAVRFFTELQNPSLKDIEFEFPVRIKKGTWGILIPDSIVLLNLAKVAGGIVATTYAANAAKKMAEHDFENIGFKTIIQKSLKAIQWVAKIGKHFGTLKQKKFSKNLKWRNNNKEVGIVGINGERLYIPIEFLEYFSSSNSNILSDLAEIIEEKRELVIGINENDNIHEVKISNNDKFIFFQAEDQQELLFPELVHGMSVSLEGNTTRGNENTNTIGFRYEGHILTCSPESGSIVKFKECLFLPCKMTGKVSRKDKFGGFNELKPKIIFADLEPISYKPGGQENLSLF